MCAFSLSFLALAAQIGPSGSLGVRSFRFHPFQRTDSSNSKTPPSRRGERWRLDRMRRSSTSIWISLTLSGTTWKTMILRKLISVAVIRDSLTPRSMRRYSVKMGTFLSDLRICDLQERDTLTRITFLSPLNSGWFITLRLRESRSNSWDRSKKLNKAPKMAQLSNKTTFSLLISARYSLEMTRSIKVFRDNACLKKIYSEIAMIITSVGVKKSSFFTRDQDSRKPPTLRILFNLWNLADSPLSNNSSSKTWEDHHQPLQDRINSLPSSQASSWYRLWSRDSVTL